MNAFQDLKLGKKCKYMILKISDDGKAIVLEKTSSSEDYDEFLKDLPEAEPRWAVYDFQYQKGEDGVRNKILFYAWWVIGYESTPLTPLVGHQTTPKSSKR